MPSMKDLLLDRPYELPAPPARVAFDGATYDPQRDHERLRTQQERVFDLMKDGQWRALHWIAEAAGGSEAAISARLRDLRKPKYGSHLVDKECHRGGLWLYRVRVRG